MGKAGGCSVCPNTVYSQKKVYEHFNENFMRVKPYKSDRFCLFNQQIQILKRHCEKFFGFGFLVFFKITHRHVPYIVKSISTFIIDRVSE